MIDQKKNPTARGADQETGPTVKAKVSLPIEDWRMKKQFVQDNGMTDL